MLHFFSQGLKIMWCIAVASLLLQLLIDLRAPLYVQEWLRANELLFATSAVCFFIWLVLTPLDIILQILDRYFDDLTLAENENKEQPFFLVMGVTYLLKQQLWWKLPLMFAFFVFLISMCRNIGD